MRTKQKSAFADRKMLGRAIKDSFAKLSPKTQAKNPVMFLVFVSAILTSILWVVSLFGLKDAPSGYTLAIAIILWFTVLFANFAEAIAEGRGKAQADSLRSSRKDVDAHKIPSVSQKDSVTVVPSALLKKGELVIVKAGEQIPADGEVIEGAASVDESAITGESAPVIREAGGDRSAVTGGTSVLSDWIVVRVTNEAGESFLDKMIAMVEGAARKKTPNEIALQIFLVALSIIFILVTVSLYTYSIFSAKLAGIENPTSVTTLVAASFAMISGRKISLMQRSTMQEAISAPKVGGIVRLTGFIVRVTLVMELLCAAVMAPVFCRDFGKKGLWMALFHSVSAFCNAGFDLLGVRTPFSSLTSYAANPVINFTIMFLIVFGGIGFLTWDDIRTNRLHLHKYRMQSKVILCTTAVLLIAPAMYFYFFEFDDLTRKERLLSSLFQAVTPRTAGFNTVDLTDLSEAGQFITIALMLIGGSPGSTAGGLKTTTIAVMLTTAISTFRRRENANLFGRRIDDDVVKNAATISLMYITLCCTGGLIISVSEGLPMLTCLFETASAVGTVGLSLGITPELNLLSRSVLILLMFFGRVGGLTLIFAALSSAQKKVSKLPKEKITVG